MADYAIYGSVSNKDDRLIVINESDWTLEKDIYPMPLTEPLNFDENTEYWVECTAGKKLVSVKLPTGEIIAKGNVDAVLYWTDRLANWENDTSTGSPNQQYGVNWSWTGTIWTATNNNAFPVTVYLRAVGTWVSAYKPGYFKIGVQYSEPIPPTIVGTFATGDLDGIGGLYSTFNIEDLSRSKEGLRTILENEYDISRLGILIPAGETAGIYGIWFSTQTWSSNAEGWISQTGHIKWESGNAEAAWNGEAWQVVGPIDMGVELSANSNWIELSKPTYYRISIDSSAQRYAADGRYYVYITDDNDNMIVEHNSVVSGEILPLGTNYSLIDYLNIYTFGEGLYEGPSLETVGDTLLIDNIEFYYGTDDPTPWKGYDTISRALQANNKDVITEDVWTPIYVNNTYIAISVNIIRTDKDVTIFGTTCPDVFSYRIYRTDGFLISDWEDSEDKYDSKIAVISGFASPINLIILIRNTNPSTTGKDYFIVRYGNESAACSGESSIEDAITNTGTEIETMGELESFYVRSDSYYSIMCPDNIDTKDINVHTGSNDGPFTVHIWEEDPNSGDKSQFLEVEATDSSGTGVGPWEVDATGTPTISESYITIVIHNEDSACSFFTLVATFVEGEPQS